MIFQINLMISDDFSMKFDNFLHENFSFRERVEPHFSFLLPLHSSLPAFLSEAMESINYTDIDLALEPTFARRFGRSPSQTRARSRTLSCLARSGRAPGTRSRSAPSAGSWCTGATSSAPACEPNCANSHLSRTRSRAGSRTRRPRRPSKSKRSPPALRPREASTHSGTDSGKDSP